jgi:HSP20 family protein
MAMRIYERPRHLEMFDRLFDRWPAVWWTRDFDDVLRVDEFQDDDGTWVTRAELAGIDPEEDIDISVANGVLHIRAERRVDEKTEEKDFYRRELRCGSFTRDLVLPEGSSEDDVTASYKDGILEVRVPMPAPPTAKEPKKVTVGKG